MAYKDLEGFQTVAFKSEREAAFEDFSKRQPLMSAASEDNSTFIFKISQIVGSRIYLTAAEETRPARVGEELRLIFSLATGQYAIVATVESSSTKGSVVVDFAKADLLRLQRRDSFRIVVPQSIALEFHLESRMKVKEALRVVDVSLGGAAIRMTQDQVSSYWVGSSIKGALVMHGREPIDLEGTIRHHFPKEAGGTQKVGVQFLKLSPDQQRELLSLTLQLHREINRK